MSENPAASPNPNPTAETGFEVCVNFLAVVIVATLVLPLSFIEALGATALAYFGGALIARGWGFGYFRATMAEGDIHGRWIAEQQLAAMQALAGRETAEREKGAGDVLAGRGDSRDDG